MRTAKIFAAFFAAGLAVTAAGAQAAEDYFPDFATAKAPAPPALKPVTIDSKTTALLLLDFAPNCAQNPRCASALPKMKTLLTSARAHGLPVIYTHTRQNTAGALPAEIAAQAGEPNLDARANKFYNSEMDGDLKAKGVKTVIVCGIQGEDAVLFTAFGAAERGYSVIVPVDCMPTKDGFETEAALDRIAHGASVGMASTLTATDMISF